MSFDDGKERREFREQNEQIQFLAKCTERAEFLSLAAFGFDIRIQGFLELSDAAVKTKPFGGECVPGSQLSGAPDSRVPFAALHFLAAELRMTFSYQSRWNSFAQLGLTSPPTME